MIPNQPNNPNSAQLYYFIIDPGLIEKYCVDPVKDLFEKARKVHSEKIDFNQTLIEIEKKLVTYNPLPPSRFGEEEEEDSGESKENSKLFLITNTHLQVAIDELLKKFYNRASKEQKYWITGPSGIGKTFSILTNVLKTRRSNSNDLVLIHIILSGKYFEGFFADFFFNDLVYGFSYFLDDESFPPCPYIKKTIGKPLMDWMLYIYTSRETKNEDYRCFYNFFEKARNFCETSQKQIVIQLDQTNIIDRLKKIKFLNAI